MYLSVNFLKITLLEPTLLHGLNMFGSSPSLSVDIGENSSKLVNSKFYLIQYNSQQSYNDIVYTIHNTKKRLENSHT